MKQRTKVFGIVGVVSVLLIGFIVIQTTKDEPKTNSLAISPASIVGCYVGKLAKDKYILDITKDDGLEVQAKIAYLNFEKDQAKGTFLGTYKKDVLTGIYTFTSEGIESRRDLIFKRVGRTFVAGYGPTEVTGDYSRIIDSRNLTWESKFAFEPATDCTF